MWCHNCGQDVPRVASPESGRMCCLRCGKPVGQEPSARSQRDSAPVGDRAASDCDVPGRRPSGYDGWALDEDLRHVGRLLGTADRAERPRSKRRLRIDAAHDGPLGPHPHQGARAAKPAPGEGSVVGALVGAIAWLTLTLGLMTSTCGGVLLVWAAVARRSDLWDVGLPIALVGLLGLVVAMVLQLDRLAGDHRRTAARLAQFDSRLVQLRRDAAMSSADARPAGASFYSHLAGGASPELLLTDLKSQLELLTERLGQPESAETPADDA